VSIRYRPWRSKYKQGPFGSKPICAKSAREHDKQACDRDNALIDQPWAPMAFLNLSR
jgi:hypothetical protein